MTTALQLALATSLVFAWTASATKPCHGSWPKPSSCSVSTVQELLLARDFQVIREIILEAGTYSLGEKEPSGFYLWRSLTLKAAPGATPILQRAPTASSKDLGRVLNIGASTSSFVEGLVIRGGYVQDHNGAGILNRGNLTLKDCVVTDNVAHGAPPKEGSGGGIVSVSYESFNMSVYLTLLNTTVTANQAANKGGGVFVDQGTCNTTCSFFNADDNTRVFGNTPDDIYPPP